MAMKTGKSDKKTAIINGIKTMTMMMTKSLVSC
jgi:hypothetical protein